MSQELTVIEALLTRRLSPHCHSSHPVTIVRREPNLYSSTFHTEILVVRLPNGSELRVLCKHYGELNQPDYLTACHGHRRGIPYEALVYQHLLAHQSLTVPNYLGTYYDPQDRNTWLFLEYLNGADRVSKGPQPNTMGLAARWIGHFHHLNEDSSHLPANSFLIHYDEEYYLGFARRALDFARLARDHYPWLRRLCQRFEGLLPLLLRSPQTVIHGEYCPVNVLFRGHDIFPVDWESAAVAVGEIDLAALTDGSWGDDVVSYCTLQYTQARWPQGTPASFKRTFAAARVYLNLRWLGHRPDWTADERSRRRFEWLRLAGEELGLV